MVAVCPLLLDSTEMHIFVTLCMEEVRDSFRYHSHSYLQWRLEELCHQYVWQADVFDRMLEDIFDLFHGCVAARHPCHLQRVIVSSHHCEYAAKHSHPFDCTYSSTNKKEDRLSFEVCITADAPIYNGFAATHTLNGSLGQREQTPPPLVLVFFCWQFLPHHIRVE